MVQAQQSEPADCPAYPVIAACIGEARPPSLGEIRQLIQRVRREGFPGSAIDSAMRRRISLTALAALGVPVPRAPG
jgi:hypothetical protein